MKCPNCGYNNGDDDSFCISCGIEIRVYQRDVVEQESCPKCGTMNKAGSGKCSSCGAKIESKFTICPECGARNLSSERWCVKCDFEIAKPVPESVAPLSPEPMSAPQQASHELRCPKCSGPMQPGIMLVPNGGLLSGVRWDVVDGIDVWGTKGEMLVPSDIMQVSIRVPGFRCPTCRVLVLPY